MIKSFIFVKTKNKTYQMNYLKLTTILGIVSTINAQKLELPESATFDTKTNSYYITSLKNNAIFKQDKNGNKSLFTEIDSHHTLGITSSNNTIYVVADDQIKGINIATKKEVFSITINDAQQLNDITNDKSGNLYVSDKVANVIYKINIETKKYSQLVKTNEVISPNGVYFDSASKSLFVCTSVEKGEIFEVNTSTGEAKLLYRTNYGNFDGIAVDNHHNIYVTSWDKEWKTGKLLKFITKSTRKQPIILVDSAKGMADLNYNAKEDKIIVANTLDNSISTIKVK